MHISLNSKERGYCPHSYHPLQAPEPYQYSFEYPFVCSMKMGRFIILSTNSAVNGSRIS